MRHSGSSAPEASARPRRPRGGQERAIWTPPPSRTLVYTRPANSVLRFTPAGVNHGPAGLVSARESPRPPAWTSWHGTWILGGRLRLPPGPDREDLAHDVVASLPFVHPGDRRAEHPRRRRLGRVRAGVGKPLLLRRQWLL